VPNYPTPGALGTWDYTSPGMGLGWRVAYLSAPIGPHPWGNLYFVFSPVFINPIPWHTMPRLVGVSPPGMPI
jgi:hypothetical protein